MNLYEVNNKIKMAIEECVDKETGEILNPELIDELKIARDEKIENVALYIKNKVAEIKALDEEAKNLLHREKILNNRVEWLKKYLAENLQGSKFETPKVVISFRKSEQLQIDSVDNIPKEYLVEQAPKINKMALKKFIKGGEEIKGISIINKQNIQIK